jgi:hypothetical protein
MEVGAWLQYLGLERYEPAFRNSEITAEVLPELTDAGLQELGPRKVLLKAIGSLRAPSGAVSEMRDDIASVPQPEGQPARCPRPTGSDRPKIVARGVSAYVEEVIVALRQQNPGTGIRRWSQCSEPHLKTLSQHAEQA